ncbi:hypothetical protein [Streptomyces sp. NPDC058735]|uniref:hypothetical protein n=1 Tax=unclassified Streptomyces TaxID=2593676 RepID=UPI0036B7033E
MTGRTGDDTAAPVPGVLLRADGEVDEETLEYARTTIDAVVGRPGLPAVSGDVRITRASAHHADRPWSATATLGVGRRDVVVLAEEATGRELIDQSQDRLRRQGRQGRARRALRTRRPPGGGTPALGRLRLPAS